MNPAPPVTSTRISRSTLQSMFAGKPEKRWRTTGSRKLSLTLVITNSAPSRNLAPHRGTPDNDGVYDLDPPKTTGSALYRVDLGRISYGLRLPGNETGALE